MPFAPAVPVMKQQMQCISMASESIFKRDRVFSFCVYHDRSLPGSWQPGYLYPALRNFSLPCNRAYTLFLLQSVKIFDELFQIMYDCGICSSSYDIIFVFSVYRIVSTMWLSVSRMLRLQPIYELVFCMDFTADLTLKVWKSSHVING